VLRVNGDDPEAVVLRIAARHQYARQFHADIAQWCATLPRPDCESDRLFTQPTTSASKRRPFAVPGASLVATAAMWMRS
jgi:2-oxoglutarate dehydrogenase complex dehydrogenase (E1) component-like enzyme